MSRNLWQTAALVVLASAVGATPPPDHVALTGARIIPVVGPEIKKGTILIERGLISAVGPSDEVKIPFDAREFDLSGKVVLPGLINVHTQDSLDVPFEQRSVTPQLDAADAIEPASLSLEDALRLGVTALHVMPGNNVVIGGLGRSVRPIGLNLASMTITPGAFLKLSVSPKSGYDRMRQMAELREAFAELGDYQAKLAERKYEEKLQADEKPLEVGPAEARKRGRDLIEIEDLDDQHRNLLRLVGGRIRVGDENGPTLFEPLGAFIYCERAMDVSAAVRIAKDNGFFDRTVLVLGGECFKAVDELKRAARPVVLPSDLIYRERDLFTGDEKEYFVPKLLADAGLQFALVPGPSDSLAERMLTYQAARCVRAGIARDVALRAITLQPAKMLGLERQLGSIEVGKSASLAVFSGEPLDYLSQVEMVFIDGIPAYERSKDVRLKRLLSTASGSAPARE